MPERGFVEGGLPVRELLKEGQAKGWQGVS